jgi:tRNA threonylcarbamoyladenosine dehydratase
VKPDKRFTRLELTLGETAVTRLNNARVTIVGIGGVGGIAAETLVRSGLGHLRIIDTDTIHSTDINRQLFALDSTMGRSKVDVAKERFLDINPSLNITALHEFFHAETARRLLLPEPDFVIDAIDAVLPKVELLAFCRLHSIPVISVMGAALKTDYRNIFIADLHATTVCPLARIIRRRLGRRGIRNGITCVYSTESRENSAPPGTTQQEFSSSVSRGRPRQVLGSYGPMTNIFGILAADFVIKAITEK